MLSDAKIDVFHIFMPFSHYRLVFDIAQIVLVKIFSQDFQEIGFV